jgi:hypothetical protein
MTYPEMRAIGSPSLTPPALPPDPTDCAVEFEAVIGPAGGEGEETFRFTVVTPRYLAHFTGAAWGRGKMIVDEFEWNTVVEAIATLLARCARPTWPEIVAELDKELLWDFGASREPQA